MIVKEREALHCLLIADSLRKRHNLSDKEIRQVSNLVKGFEGESVFDGMTEKLTCDCLVLNDLLLKVNTTLFQIDSLVMTGNDITLYEIKNYEGEYVFEEERIRMLPSKKEITSPLIQLSRTLALFRQLMEQHHFQFRVQAFVVFVNKRFTLFQNPPNYSLLMPTMLESHFEQMNKINTPINTSCRRLAETLCKLHISESPYNNFPEYDFVNLKKGIRCDQCGEWIDIISRRTCSCETCGHNELNSKTILRHVQEYQRLFPERKTTTSIIYEWCGCLFSKKSIQHVLSKHYELKGVGRGIYYR